MCVVSLKEKERESSKGGRPTWMMIVISSKKNSSSRISNLFTTLQGMMDQASTSRNQDECEKQTKTNRRRRRRRFRFYQISIGAKNQDESICLIVKREIGGIWRGGQIAKILNQLFFFFLLSLFVSVYFDLEACAIESFRFYKIDRLVDGGRGLVVAVVRVMMVMMR